MTKAATIAAAIALLCIALYLAAGITPADLLFIAAAIIIDPFGGIGPKLLVMAFALLAMAGIVAVVAAALESAGKGLKR